MRVSFLIPLYNCLPLTQAMLTSLQATLPADLDHEIILIDDGSTDGTRDWLSTLEVSPTLTAASYARRIRVLLNDRNLGYAATNNRAAAHATGNLLVLLNNDLVLTPRWLVPLLATHAALGPRAGIIGNIQRAIATSAIDHTGFVITKSAKPEQDRTLPLPCFRIKKVPAVTGACLLITRTLWQQLDGFDEAYRNGCEDIDLCLKARAAGRTNAVALRSVIGHHISASPGRRRHDEENTRRLTRRWRAALSQLGARAWCRDFLTRELNAARAFDAPLDALQFGLHAAGLLRRPPTAALRGVADALDDENIRWENLLGSTGFPSSSSAAHEAAH